MPVLAPGEVMGIGTLGVISWAEQAHTREIAHTMGVVTLLLTTVFSPLQSFLKTTSLDIRQWLICLAVALSIVVAAEIRKAVRRHTASGQKETR